MLKVGDIICVHTHALLSWLIRRLTRSWANHVAIYVGNGLMVEALGKGVVMRQVCIYEGQRRRWKVKAFRPACSDEIKQKAVDFCKGKVGMRYDFMLIFGILRAIRRYRLDRKAELGHDSRWACAELIGKAYSDAGHHFVNPKTVHISNLAPGDIMLSKGDFVKGWPR